MDNINLFCACIQPHFSEEAVGCGVVDAVDGIWAAIGTVMRVVPIIDDVE